MSDSPWDLKLKAFLKKTGDDFKRFGAEVKQEAQRLVTEVQTEVKDPQRQQQLRDALADVGKWASKTADEVATVVEGGIKKAGDSVNTFMKDNVVAAPRSTVPEPVPTAPAPPPKASPPPPPPRAKKTVGRKPAAKKPAARAPSKKTIGKKPR